MSAHTQTVQTICLSSNEKYVFSGGDDKTVIVWFTENWTKLCTLEDPL